MDRIKMISATPGDSYPYMVGTIEALHGHANNFDFQFRLSKEDIAMMAKRIVDAFNAKSSR
jgi:hypothetical protein